MPPPEPAAPVSPTDAEDARGPFIEWYSIEGPEFQNAANLLELMDILKEIRRQPGCDAVVQQKHTESPVPEFFIIGELMLYLYAGGNFGLIIQIDEIDSCTEWHDAKRRAQFLESERSRRFTQAIEENRVRKTFFARLLDEPGVSVIRGEPHSNHGLCEVLIVYFPTSLSETAAQALDRIKGPQQWEKPMSGEEIQHPLKFPGEGLLFRHRGWADGAVEYQGQPARRMIYILYWLDKLAQQRYKQEEKSKKRTRDGRTLWNAMEGFFDDLEDLGMLGYETQSTQFLDISGVYFPGDPGYVKGVNDCITPRQ